MKSMRRVPQKTVIGALRDALTEWRVRQRWSREAVADEVVKCYRAGAWDAIVGLEFQDTGSGARDIVRAMGTNADRVWRWLDDQTKSSTLLPANLLPSVLAALPPDLRLRVLTEILAPVGIEASIAAIQEVTISHAEVMAEGAKECGEGLAAFALLGGRVRSDDLQRAEIEILEAQTALQKQLDFVRAQMKGG